MALHFVFYALRIKTFLALRMLLLIVSAEVWKKNRTSDLPDSNQRPKDSHQDHPLQSSALPTELRSVWLLETQQYILSQLPRMCNSKALPIDNYPSIKPPECKFTSVPFDIFVSCYCYQENPAPIASNFKRRWEQICKI